MIKTVKPLGLDGVYIQFTEEEAKELGIQIGDEFRFENNNDETISMIKMARIDIDMTTFSKEELIEFMNISAEKDVSISKVFEDILTEAVKVLDNDAI